MTTTSKIDETLHEHALSEQERLTNALRSVRAWDVVLRPAARPTFPKRVAEARSTLMDVERAVSAPAGSSRNGEAPALRELNENRRMMRSAVAGIAGNMKPLAKLPRVALPDNAEEPRVAAVAKLYVANFDEFSPDTFRTFILTVQGHEPLTLQELWSLSGFLRFVQLEQLLAAAQRLLHSHSAEDEAAISRQLKSLRAIGSADWLPLVEPLIVFDATLRQDPANTYAAMDFESRELYRKRVALVALHSDATESAVADAALDLAREAHDQPVENARSQRKRCHVGYYLMDKGLPDLAARCGYQPSLAERVRAGMRARPDYFYITAIQLLTLFFVTVLTLPLLPHHPYLDCLIAAALLVLPASQCAVDLVNNTITLIFDPHPLPKLDFRRGIPADCTTLVTVPTLLLNEDQVRGLALDLEVRYLANRDPHLHFALLTDLADSVAQPHDRDSHPLVELAVRLIDDLNQKYGPRGEGAFLLLHRHRVFNRRQGVWMGWERKRGKLLDLNKLLMGEFDAFPIKAGRLDVLGQVRYVLTVDSDTQLPRSTAARLVGAMAHPLNQAIVHPRLRIVTEGFGILQPRIGVAVQSATRSRLASIFSGQSGFDIYTHAISDAYQELYGEGIFTGKGLYEVKIFHSVLDRRFPRNALLSHDLIEGAYARAGLATDVELIDDYPSHYSAYTRRKHRWLRGDWQIAKWLTARVPEESGHRVPNPISEISRWKILDNLRRSLVEPFTFILFVAGWLGLPGGPLYWTLVSLFLIAFPTIVQLAFGLCHALVTGRKGGVTQALSGFGQSLLLALLNLVFLPHQTLLAFDAIIRALVRVFITGERLLEWETAAESELKAAKRTAVDRYLALAPVVAIGVGLLVYLAHPHGRHLVCAAPILVLWALVDAFTAWLNAPPREENRRLTSGQEAFLFDSALRTWRYFREFGEEKHHYLIPDNVEEDQLFEAARVSPTNLGLLLNARQAACEFGFLTVPEFVMLTDRSLETIDRLEKHRGHLYNWYNTQTLETIGTRMISSVDSGNFAASLYTLRTGAAELVTRPLLSRELFTSLRTFWHLAAPHGRRMATRVKLEWPGVKAGFDEWIAWIPGAAAAFAEVSVQDEAGRDERWWLAETGKRIAAIDTLLRDYLQWLRPEYVALRKSVGADLGERAGSVTIADAIEFARELGTALVREELSISSDDSARTIAAQLKQSLPSAIENLQRLSAQLAGVAGHAERLADETEFGFLVHPYTRMLSIGFDADANKLLDACYDMLASEARIATFLAVARGELEQESWFKLARDHTMAYGRFALLSWTGTMFEYLMPALWMRNYPHTLISRTLEASVHVQRAFAEANRLPWGISESGHAAKDDAGHYHYQAFGIPAIAIKFDATAGPVISPYSTFLALTVDSLPAFKNLRRLASMGMVSGYGFYEALDFSVASGKGTPVREWMAHHQGMTLLALLNLLREGAVQRWFHANPLVQSAELVLHETPMNKAMLRAQLKEFTGLDTRAA